MDTTVLVLLVVGGALAYMAWKKVGLFAPPQPAAQPVVNVTTSTTTAKDKPQGAFGSIGSGIDSIAGGFKKLL